jgi:hypothetical protein
MFGAFGSEQTIRPLHRMTPLRDDPAVAWLSPAERTRVGTLVFFLWAAFWISVPPTWLVVWSALGGVIYSLRLSLTIVVALVVALFRPVRRAILRTRSERIEQLLRRNAGDIAADDWTALGAEPNDTVVSVVGWVRGRQHLDKPIGGEPAVGVALPCQHRFPGVFESLHDFDLVDEEGRSIFIQVSEGRTFGTPNVALDSHQLRHLYADLGVPSGATSSGWHIHSLRSGDPVMVVGYKQTVVDPHEPSFRGPRERLSLASSPPCPLLIFSLPADRRPPT